MISTLDKVKNIVTEQWIKISWDEFISLQNYPDFLKANYYYDQGEMRIEMAALGPRHGRNNAIISQLISIYAMMRNIPIVQFINTSYRKAGLREFQPDLSFYIGDNLTIPPDDNSPVNLHEYDSPNLIVEISSSTLNDDLGRKRLLYERVGISEYWVIDTEEKQAIAFSIADRRSGEIEQSLVLPGLNISLIAEVLQRSENHNDTLIYQWLLQIFS